MLKNLAFVINCNQIYIRHTEEEAPKNKQVLNTLFENISNIYIPVLNMFEKFEKESVLCRVGFVLAPVLCGLLSDSKIQDLYVEYLDQRIEFGKIELERCKNSPELTKNVEAHIARFTSLKNDFIEKYHQNLIKAFQVYVQKGYIELLATCGTDVFIPHYADMKEIISAQIESGLHSYKQYFGEIPEGFWLPELGYINGVEKLIKAYGYSYTILDSRSLLLSQTLPANGIFYPVRTDNSLVLFGADTNTRDEIFGEDGFLNSPYYRNENQDVGFELPAEKLNSLWSEGESRIATGYRYWNRNYKSVADNKSIYDEVTAQKQAADDAAYFVNLKYEKLTKASELISDVNFVTLVCTLDANELSQNWSESVIWLEYVIRQAKIMGLNVTSCDQMLEKQYELEKVVPYYSSSSGEGYGEDLLSNKNSWMMRYIHKACERMIDLADRFPNDTGLKTRLLNIGAVELMLSQSLTLAKMIDRGENPEYAERRFSESIEAFTAVFDSLGSNTVSTEWLTTLEVKDSVFPWMNYRIFSKKK